MNDSPDPVPSEDYLDPADRYVGRQGFCSGLFFLFRVLVYFLSLVWAVGAILYDGPANRGSGNVMMAAVWIVATLTFLGAARTPVKRFLVWLTAMAIVLIPWLMLRPSNDRDWEPEWKNSAWAEIDGDTVTFHNFRNFDWALDGTFEESWETRAVHLSNLQGLDYFHHAISGKVLAHPVLSFDFGDEGHVAFSVEVRREVGEEFSVIGGFYKMFELIYLVGDERDFVRERASVRDQPVRLYRARFSGERVRTMFLETVEAMNALREQPRFYNTFTANCTTSYRSQAPVDKRAKFDWRLVFNGQIEELLYERGALVTGDRSFGDLVEQASINEASQAAFGDPDYSKKIREGRVGF